ncbi:NAD(P)H-dependent oxidoreductase [Sphingobium sp. BYY-5]|uniref:NAD(P)H-dependent oxidoreductase n=1 Tax=Sphingobium sp. BYY-5 TaxID=2926400 RepID=UPI001FA7D6BD|nr:NAD(P)H-dependent oxidoreductase [Sphingobium sp. BYY-5]MCI4592477.1 NAD(P)H-dependent oxidoreductase [Sphingobium sp. BYY-5]
MINRRAPKHAVIVCHPAEDSFTMSVARRYRESVEALRHDVVVRDLYRLGFDPVLKADERPTSIPYALSDDVAQELQLLSGSDVFVLVYPIWFGSPPAMIKGYIDRVLGAGFPYGAVRDRRFHPLMAGKRLVSFTSSGTTRAWLEEQGAWLSLRTLYDTYMRHAFSLEATEHIHFDAIAEGLKKMFVDQNLFQVEEAARLICSWFVHNWPVPSQPAPKIAPAI